MKSIRRGDSVLVRCPIGECTAFGAGVQFPTLQQLVPLDKCDIVAVEQSYRVGDRVEMKLVQGEIIALSPEGVEPPQAWVKVAGEWPVRTWIVKEMRRIDI